MILYVCIDSKPLASISGIVVTNLLPIIVLAGNKHTMRDDAWAIPWSIYTFFKRQILDSSKLKEFADDNFKFDENGIKFFKRVENTVGKGEIARYEQFLLFLQCFQRNCTADA